MDVEKASAKRPAFTAFVLQIEVAGKDLLAASLFWQGWELKKEVMEVMEWTWTGESTSVPCGGLALSFLLVLWVPIRTGG